MADANAEAVVRVERLSKHFGAGAARVDALVDIKNDHPQILYIEGEPRWEFKFLRRAVQALVVSPFVSQRLRPFAATNKRDDLVVLTELIESGKVTPVIDSTYPLREAAEALSHYGAGHARGKVTITMRQNGAQERGD